MLLSFLLLGGALADAASLQGLFGLSREEVEGFNFSSTYVDSTMAWRIRRTDRDLLKLLRQKAKFVLQNNPDPMAEAGARIVVRITDEMGLGDDGPPPPPDPPPPGPPPGSGILIVPGNASGSPLVQRVEGTRIPAMPLGRPLPSDKVRLFRQWVQAGAKEDFYKQKVAPIVAANCVFCHSKATHAAGLSLETWDDVRARIARQVTRR